MAEQMAANLAALRNKGGTTSPEPASPQSPTVPTIPSKGDQLLRNLMRMTTPVVNEPDPLPVSVLPSKRRAVESNKESLKLLDEIMRRQEQKNPELAAKQARLLQILAASRLQPGEVPSSGPAGPPRKPQKPTG